MYNLNLVDVVELSPRQTIFLNMDLMVFFVVALRLHKGTISHLTFHIFFVFFSVLFSVEPQVLALDSLIHTV